MPTPFQISQEDYQDLRDNGGGYCLSCREQADCVEPDARNYTCEACDDNKVFGIEELLMMGLIEFLDD
jgi:hypothetical protein